MILNLSRSVIMAAFSLAALLSSCKKQESEIQTALDEVDVPANFNWNTARDVIFNVSITDARFENSLHVITVYDKAGKLLAKGSASRIAPFAVKVYLPATITEVYIYKISPDNSRILQKVTITGTTMNVSFAETTGKVGLKGGITIKGDEEAKSPDCTTDCDVSINLRGDDNLTIEKGQTVCVSGTGKTFNVTFGEGGGNLRICGTKLTLNNINDNSNGSKIGITVTNESTVTFPNLNFNGAENSLENFGEITFQNNLALPGTLKNYGTITVNGDYNTNTEVKPGTAHVNYATINVEGSMNVGAITSITNNGHITIGKDLEVNGKSKFYNNCYLYVEANYNQSSQMENYGYINVNGETHVNGGSVFNEYSGAMLQTGHIIVDELITGLYSTSLIKVKGKSIINGSGIIADNIQFCDEDGIETNDGKFTGAASVDCDLYIPVTECNEDGNGKQSFKDSDDDGVVDSQDSYPDDPEKAFDNFYPLSGGGAVATVAFEDLWPAKGDYDMNDVVVSYWYNVVTNAKNVVVQVKANYTLKAAGGNYQNGFGIEFPIKRDQAFNVEGGSLEDGQSKVVIVLFSQMQNEIKGWNTKNGESTAPYKDYNVSFDVKGGPELLEFGLGSYNPFIWNNAFGRGHEVHLPGYTPTDKADIKLFGTGEDSSNPDKGRYYLTKRGYPFAINLPVDFEYPYEEIDISKAYLHLGDWVRSGGTRYIDWYIDQQGYRDSKNIYEIR